MLSYTNYIPLVEYLAEIIDITIKVLQFYVC